MPAPIALATSILKFGLPSLVGLVGKAVGRSDDPMASEFASLAERVRARALDPSDAFLSPEQSARVLRDELEVQKAEVEAAAEVAVAVQETQRAAVDAFIQAEGWKAVLAFLIADARPSCVRSLSLSFLFLNVIVGWAVLRDGEVTLTEVGAVLSALFPYWGAMASVGGLYQVARSMDKRGGAASASGGGIGGAWRGLAAGWRGQGVPPASVSPRP